MKSLKSEIMFPFNISKLRQNAKSALHSAFSISDEFYYFLILLAIFNSYIWCTLQYHDPVISPLSQHSIKDITSASFDDTISRLSPHFASFEHNCRQRWRDYTLSPWTYVCSVLAMDWTFRLLYLCALHRLAVLVESKYKCKFRKLIAKHLVSASRQQHTAYRAAQRLCMFLLHSLVLFGLYALDCAYTRWRYADGADSPDPSLMDFADLGLMDRLRHFVWIFVRVHPSDAWMVRLSHGLSYPLTLFAVSRPRLSDFVRCHALCIALWAFHIGGLAHTLDDSDMQLRCVRRSFIWSTRGTSIHGEALRSVAAPYLNLVCLTVNCAKYVL